MFEWCGRTSFLKKKSTIAVAVIMLVVLIGSYIYVASQPTAELLLKRQQEQEYAAKQKEFQNAMTYLMPSSAQILGFPQVRGPANRVLFKDTFEGLVRYEGSSLDVKPALAERWDISPDGKVYTFYLRKNVTFYPSGDPFNAAAVKFTYDAAFKTTLGSFFGGPDWLQYDRTEIVDDYTVKVYIKRPLAWFMRILTFAPMGSIMNPKFINAHGGIPKSETEVDPYLILNQDVTGPYIVEQFKPDDRIILKRNPTYWMGWTGERSNRPERVVIRSVPEASSRIMLMARGDADLAFIDLQYLPELKKRIATENLSLVIDEIPNFALEMVLFDHLRPPTNDVHVRRALSMSFNYDQYIQKVMFGFGDRLVSFTPKGMWGYMPDVSHYTFDLDKASKELQLAAPENLEMLKKGIKITYTPGYGIPREGYLMWKSDLAKIGVNLILEEVAYWVYQDAMRSGGVSMLDRRWTMDFPDPASFTSFLQNSYYLAQKFGTSPSKIDGLLEKAAFEVDPSKRLQTYREIEEWSFDSAPYIKVASRLGGGQYNVHSSFVKGYEPHPIDDSKPLYYSLWKELPKGTTTSKSLTLCIMTIWTRKGLLAC